MILSHSSNMDLIIVYFLATAAATQYHIVYTHSVFVGDFAVSMRLDNLVLRAGERTHSHTYTQLKRKIANFNDWNFEWTVEKIMIEKCFKINMNFMHDFQWRRVSLSVCVCSKVAIYPFFDVLSRINRHIHISWNLNADLEYFLRVAFCLSIPR